MPPHRRQVLLLTAASVLISALDSRLLRFYGNARDDELYPQDPYVLKNAQELFAVTGSFYLWGNVGRLPHIRENLREKQPAYYKWLGELFGMIA
jgi:hypothetical protein